MKRPYCLTTFDALLSCKLFLFAFLFMSHQVKSQNLDERKIEKIDNHIKQYIVDDAPGVAVGMVMNGNTVYEKYFGYANLEHQVKTDSQTRFNIASNAKQYTALCILKLIEDGVIELEDDIRKYLPKLYEQSKYEITISNLITHTSGIRDVYDLWALKGMTWWKLFVDNKDAMQLIENQTDLNFTPGSDYLYSNSNYILLTEIIKTVTGMNFSEYAKAVFDELGMTSTSFLTNYMKVVPQKARPYGNWGGWREYPSITETHGDGALYTNLSDQLQWERIIQLREVQNISQSLITKSQSPISSSSTMKYGYGLMFGKYKDIDYAYHDGSTGAYNATFLRFADNNVAIVVMSNNGNVPTNYLAKQIADITLGLTEMDTEYYQALPEKTEIIKNTNDLVGHYQEQDGSVIKISENDGFFFREIYRRDPVKLIPERDGLFHYEGNKDLKMNFLNIGTKEQKFTIYLASQKPIIYHKIQDVDFDKSDLNGRFYNIETETEIVIDYIEGSNYKITKNGRERDAKLILNDYLRMMDSYKIKVIRDEAKNVIGLNVENNRIRNVIFTKEQ